MHILIVTDQHPDSLGGAQVAIRAQRASLERLGHRVTIVAPELHRPGYTVAEADRAAYLNLPSRPITKDREYGISLPGKRVRRALDAGLAGLPAVDIVHVQGDFWGAMIGVRAARDLKAPLIFTMHNNVDKGTRSVTPFAPLAFVGLRVWRACVLGRPRGRVGPDAVGVWRYLAELAAEASAVIAPSRHFAKLLEEQDVAPEVAVVRGGVDDELIEKTKREPRGPRSRPQLVWLGRMSHEKRVFQFIDAIERSNIDADVRLYGSGILLKQVQSRIVSAGLQDRVSVEGPVPHERALQVLHEADLLVQTSNGFETQGLTPFEAALVGTPTVFCDPAIASDLSVRPAWVADSSQREAHGDGRDEISALTESLCAAVAQIAAAQEAGGDGSSKLRVSEAQTKQFLQSEQTKGLIEIYYSALGWDPSAQQSS